MENYNYDIIIVGCGVGGLPAGHRHPLGAGRAGQPRSLGVPETELHPTDVRDAGPRVQPATVHAATGGSRVHRVPGSASGRRKAAVVLSS